MSEGNSLSPSHVLFIICRVFEKNYSNIAPNVFSSNLVNDKPLEIVQPVKLLALNLSSDLKWNHHVPEITKNTVPRFCFLRQLKRVIISEKDLLNFYTSQGSTII